MKKQFGWFILIPDTNNIVLKGGETLERMTLRQMRRVRDKTQAQMAQEMKVTIPTYQAWEKCPARVKTGKLLEVLHILGFSIDDLKLFNTSDSAYMDSEWGD